MRDRCYLNRRTGEIRDEVRLEQGYAEAARWLGLKRVKTIWEWLRSADVAIFLREMNREIGTWEEASRRIKVCLGEPMTDEDQDQANTLLAKSPYGASVTHSNPENIEAIGASGSHSELINDGAVGASGIPSEVNDEGDIGASVTHSDAKDEPAVGASCTRGNQQIGASDSHSGASVTHSDAKDEPAVGASCIRGNQQIGASDSHSGATDTHRRGASVTHSGASVTIDWRDWHSLNSLTPVFKHLNNTQTTYAAKDNIDPENINSEVEKEVVAGEWKLSDLLTLNRISSKKQDLLLGSGLTAQAFISWLLYAASRNGNGINDPIGHAVSRLLQDPTRGAGGAFDRLAELPANEPTGLLQRELDGQSPWNTDWRTAMDGAPRARLRALADQLGVLVLNSNDW
jgi:hypothetical protein